jgi:O-antigen/teichoic acid export membrane protein
MNMRHRFRGLVGTKDSLKARSIAAAAWSFGGMGAQRGLSLVSNLIMTRLLVPEAFGLMAMVITVQTLVNMLSDIGVRQSIVRSPRGEELHFLQVAWSVQIVRSTVVAAGVVACGLGLWLLGPSLAAPDSVYADPQLPALVMVSSLTILLGGLQSTAILLAGRRLQLRKITIIEVGNQVFTIAAMVALAQIQATVWVLLAGMIIGSVQRTFWTHVAFRETPMRLVWDRDIAAEMWRFGRWLIGSSMAGFVVNNGDRFILAALLDATTFGVYVIATLWLQTGTMILGRFGDRVVYPAIAETLHRNRPRFPHVLRRLRLVYGTVAVAGFATAFLGGPFLIGWLYAPEYAAAGTFLSLLGFRYLAMLQAPLGAAMLAAGNSRLMMTSITMSAVAMAVGMPVAFNLGGADAAVAVAALAPLGGVGLLLRNVHRQLPDVPLRASVAIVAATLVLAVAALTWDLWPT